MQRDLSHTALDELEVDDLAFGIQLCDEAVVISGVWFAIKIGDEIFTTGGVTYETIGRRQACDLCGLCGQNNARSQYQEQENPVLEMKKQRRDVPN